MNMLIATLAERESEQAVEPPCGSRLYMPGRWRRELVCGRFDGGEDGVGLECRAFAPEPTGGAEQVTLIGEGSPSESPDLLQPGQPLRAGSTTAETGDVEMWGEIGRFGAGCGGDPVESGPSGCECLVEFGMLTPSDAHERISGGTVDIGPTGYPLRQCSASVAEGKLAEVSFPDHQCLEVAQPGNGRLGLDQQAVEVVGGDLLEIMLAEPCLCRHDPVSLMGMTQMRCHHWRIQQSCPAAGPHAPPDVDSTPHTRHTHESMSTATIIIITD
jgi:hypothetical protein